MAADPWFWHANYKVFELLFAWIPHSGAVDDFCDALISTPLFSTWVFAASFYHLWTRSDDKQKLRREYLVRAVVAFAIAAIVTVVLRPWIHWPAPVLNPSFQALFPRYLWGNGSRNCFPSHSTLAYFMMAMGIWPINRRLSCGLAGFALLFISLPRVYVGGHYPIDVLFSCVLGVLTLAAVWRWPSPVGGPRRLKTSGLTLESAGCHLMFFLWVFELGEGFRGVEALAAMLSRIFLKR